MNYELALRIGAILSLITWGVMLYLAEKYRREDNATEREDGKET